MRKDWVETTLDDIAKWGSGGTPKSTIPEYYDGDIPWLIIGDLNDSYVSTSEKKITELGLKNSSAKWVKADSVLIAMYGSIGKLGINKIPVTTNQAIAFTQTLYGDIQNKYLFYYLLLCRPKLHKVGKGGTQKNISQTVLKTIDFPLAPLLEQKAIVAKIEQLFSELNNAVANLKTAKAKLKIYRQAVLKKAFEGELTKEWREKQTNLPTADELLEQIKKEREVHYKQQLEEWKQAVKEWEENGQNSKKPSKPKQYKEKIEKFEYTKTKIPENWNWTAFGKLFLTSPQNGIYKPASDYGTGTYIIRIDDFYDGKLIKKNGFKRLRLTDDEAKIYGVEENSIFINRVNSMEYLGKCALVEKLDENVVFESNIMKINTMLVNNKYLTIFLSSRKGMQNLQINAKQAVNQASINQTDVSSTLVPLCSLEEQNQIVQEIESRLSVCDKIEETIKTTLAKSEALRQSILKKAFEGKLLSAQELENIKNHPEYESAEALLKRIKNERDK
ncbi:MAG: restriction endonuclease subunit S [Campylobacterales bacterium]|nr:restriction endonuclease subunit S [Campylobacterales bacterium]